MTELLANAVAQLEQLAYPEARDLAQQHLADHPDDSLGWGVLAAAQLELDDADAALASTERWIALQPATASAHTLLSRIQNRRAQPDAARIAASDAIALSPGDYLSHLELGRALASLGDYPAALDSLSAATTRLGETDPALAPVLGLEAIVRLELGEKDSAEALLRRAITLAPETPEFAALLDSLSTRELAASVLVVTRRQANLLMFGHAIALAIALIATVLISPDNVLGGVLPRIFGGVALVLSAVVVLRSVRVLAAEGIDRDLIRAAVREYPAIGTSLVLQAIALVLPLTGLVLGAFVSVPLAILFTFLALLPCTFAARAILRGRASDARENI